MTFFLFAFARLTESRLADKKFRDTSKSVGGVGWKICNYNFKEQKQKTHLLGEGVPVEELHRLQMGMELLDHGELLFQQVLDDVSHRHVVRQSNPVAHRDELAASASKTRTPVKSRRCLLVDLFEPSAGNRSREFPLPASLAPTFLGILWKRKEIVEA